MVAPPAELAKKLAALAQARQLTIVVAESCTAGALARVLSDAEGAASFFHGGFVTYTKRHKTRALGVPTPLLQREGAVCPEVARAMAQGALLHSEAHLAAAITGVAGPEPDEDGNPVGRVCIGIAGRGLPARSLERHYPNVGRDEIRKRAVADALKAMAEALGSVSAAA